MNQIIKIHEDMVDARELHKFMGVRSQFRDWIKNRIREYEFIEGEDYSKALRNYRGSDRVEYSITLDMAKELAMVERNPKGREARRYFIKCEQVARSMVSNQISWSQARVEGKQSRRLETDLTKKFVEYAEGQGSKSAKMYYMNFSKMVNKSLLEFEGKAPKELRDHLNRFQLHSISIAETIIARTLAECMGQKRFYKDIYKIAKERIEAYSLTVGRTKLGASDREVIGLIA